MFIFLCVQCIPPLFPLIMSTLSPFLLPFPSSFSPPPPPNVHSIRLNPPLHYPSNLSIRRGKGVHQVLWRTRDLDDFIIFPLSLHLLLYSNTCSLSPFLLFFFSSSFHLLGPSPVFLPFMLHMLLHSHETLTPIIMGKKERGMEC